MKRKVGELFNKPIVQGNKNALSYNEILVEQKGDTISLKERVNGEIKEVSGRNSGGGARNIKYYRIAENGRPYVTYASEIKVNGGIQQPCAVFMSTDDPVSVLKEVEAAKFDLDAFALYNAEEKITVKDAIAEFVDPEAELFIEITEEEFYTI